MNATRTLCVLCGDADARAREVDRENRIFFDCGGLECGRYEISVHAMTLLADNPCRAGQVRALVARHASPSGLHYVEIVVNADGQFQAPPINDEASK